ncbi:MAG: SDR family oxidoreductase [Betaproteobacteria bacterium]
MFHIVNLIVQTIAAGRMGDLLEFGDTCAFMCSHQASFMSGQNIQLDGGARTEVCLICRVGS